MSARMVHRLRCEKDKTKIQRKYRELGNNANLNSDLLWAVGFDSETLSSPSPLQLNINSEKRLRRKKIRCTQDFNQLNSSITSPDSDESTKNNTKTRKIKKLYSLPKISHVAEDCCIKPEHIVTNSNYGESVPKKRGRKKSKKHEDVLQHVDNENQKKGRLTRQNKVEQCNDKQDTEKENSTEQYESANSVVLDGQSDSEVEIVIKKRKKKLKKRSNKSNIDGNTEKAKQNNVESYTKRIKMLLSDQPMRKTKSNDSNNSLCLSSKKAEGNTSNKSLKSSETTVHQQTESRATPKANNIINSANYDKKIITTKLSASTRKSNRITFTPHTENKSVKGSSDVTEKELKQIRKDCSRISFSEKSETMKITRKGNKSTLSKNRNFEGDFDSGSDSVFNDSIGKQFDRKTDDMSIKTRKSVHFQLPGQNSRRDTLILSKSSSDNARVKFILEKSDNDVISQTFDVSSPGAEIVNDFQGISQNQETYNKSLNKDYKPNTHFGSKLSKQCMDKLTERQSSKLSPTNRAVENYLNDRNIDISVKSPIIDLITPPVPKLTNDLNVSNENNRRSTFCKSSDISNIIPADIDPITTSSLSLLENMPKLNRTATFTKDDKIVLQDPNLPPPPNFKHNSLLLNTSNTKILDTSKVNKRRRWDKSRLSVSYLDNSLDLKNISAPWQNDSNTIFDISDMHTSKQNCGIKRRSKINEKKASFKDHPTPPSGTSTPLPRGKTNLLRQALLKDNKTVAINESRSSRKHIEQPAPKFVRTKIPNFALIHQRAYDKLESLKDMSERKAARAKLLLSGHKPPSDNITKTSTNRRELNFSPTHLKLSTSKECKKNDRSLNKSNISITKINMISPSTSNPKVINKENRLTPIPIEKKKTLLKAKSQIPMLRNVVIAEKKGFTRFGFKIGPDAVKTATKDEQVKAVAAKSKIVKNTLQERRNVIKGVRSNRRFELLMNMRNHK